MVAPFFTTIIVTKVWVTADVCATLHTLTETKKWSQSTIQLATSLPIAISVVAQIFLSLKMKLSFKTSVMNCLANQISLYRPTHSEEEEKYLLPLYKSETRMSSAMYLVLAIMSLCLKLQPDLSPNNHRSQIWISQAALGFAIANLFVTQFYTCCLNSLLFEKEVKVA